MFEGYPRPDDLERITRVYRTGACNQILLTIILGITFGLAEKVERKNNNLITIISVHLDLP